MACCEFSKFHDPKMVEFMVNKNNVGICTKFFKCNLSNIKQFSLNFFDVFNVPTHKKQTAVPCFIKLWDNCKNIEGTNHAVIYIKDRGKHFLFDPNGVVDEQSHRYLYYDNRPGKGQKYDSNTLSTSLNIKTPTCEGIQATAPSVPATRTNYIGGGGYCMFYVRRVLDILETCLNTNPNANLIKIAEVLSSIEGRKYFSTGRNIGRDSVKMAYSRLSKKSKAGKKTKSRLPNSTISVIDSNLSAINSQLSAMKLSLVCADIQSLGRKKRKSKKKKKNDKKTKKK